MTDVRRREDRLVSPGWTYRRPDADDSVEFGTVGGRDVALPPHFHDEDQITFVLCGRRRFYLGGEVLTVEAGGCALIRAGVVHRSLAEPAGVDAINLYVPSGEYASAAMAREVGRLWRRAAGPEPTELMAVLQNHRLRGTDDDPQRTGPRGSVGERARRVGVSREGFSRAFTRAHGMPPHAFGLVTRLNHARRLLRHGAPIADAAADAGFADQSHLGRCFRRTFGVTPGRYRAGQAHERAAVVTNVPDLAENGL